MKVTVEVERDKNLAPLEIRIKKGRKKLKIKQIYGTGTDTFGFTVEGRREDLPSLTDIFKIVNAQRLDRIGTIEIINEVTLLRVLKELSLIKQIDVIQSVPDITPKGSDGVAFAQAPAGAGAWVSPTGHEDPDDAWEDEALAYDDILQEWWSYAETWVPKDSWGKFLVLTHAAITCNKLRLLLYYYSSFCIPDIIDIDVYDGAWHHVYEGEITAWHNGETWIEYPFSERTITKMRLRFYCPHVYCDNCRPWVVEADFWQVPATGGELHIFNHFWTGTTWKKAKCDNDGVLSVKLV